MTQLADLRCRIDEDPQLAALRDEVVSRMTDDVAHDLSHALRVAVWTLRLAEGAIDQRAAVAAALLHDVVSHAKNSPLRSHSSEDAARVARELLPLHGFSPESVSEIAAAVADHSFSAGRVPSSALGRALADADRLEALGAIGIVRCLLTGARMSARPFAPSDPWAKARELDDRSYSLDHFFTKLLALPGRMYTEAGRREAERRVTLLEQFLDELAHELDDPRP